jgi:hypothetical protein
MLFSQIWQNLPMDDHHLKKNLHMDDCHLRYMKKNYEKHCLSSCKNNLANFPNMATKKFGNF